MGAAVDACAVMGERAIDFYASEFTFYHVSGWETPSFSPVLLAPLMVPSEKSLTLVESYFRDHPTTNTALNPTAYFNVFNVPELWDLDRINAIAEQCGWIRDPFPLVVNLLTRQPQFSIPPGYYFR